MEITVHNCVRKNNQTVFVKVTEQMETKNEAKIKAMKDVVAEFIPGKDGVQVETDSRDTLMNAYKRSTEYTENRQSSSKPRSNSANNDDRITGRQIGCIRKALQEQHRSETDFCQQYHVNSVEEISKHDAQWIIKELLAKTQP